MTRSTKIFLAMGIPFGLFMGIQAGLQYGLNRGIISGLVTGLFYGFFMTLSLEGLNKLFTKKNKSEGAGGPNQLKTFTLDGSREELFDKSIRALETIKAKVSILDKEQFTIEAKTSMTWKSFGENIKIVLAEGVDKKIIVAVSSNPKLKTTLVDYGKGFQNVESLVKYIEPSKL